MNHNPSKRLVLAAEKRDFWGVVEALGSGAVVDFADENGYTALMKAAINNDTKIGELLLDNHAKPNYRPEGKLGALDLAKECENEPMVKLLKMRGAREREI